MVILSSFFSRAQNDTDNRTVSLDSQIPSAASNFFSFFAMILNDLEILYELKAKIIKKNYSTIIECTCTVSLLFTKMFTKTIAVGFKPGTLAWKAGI